MTSAIPVQRSWVPIPFRLEFLFSGFNFTTAQVVYNCNDTIKFISFSAVKIYDFSYIHLKIPYVIFLAQVNAKILACLWEEANF